VWSTIKQLHLDRAPGLDGFIKAFYERAWAVISGWKWADLDLALDLVLLAPRPIYEAMGRPIQKS
jgi:hypothetical protein